MCLKKVARLPLNSTHKQSLDVFFCTARQASSNPVVPAPITASLSDF
jgi:hypothetical protein